MARIPAMSRDEVEELIEDLSTHVGISTALADDMLDAGQLVMWAADTAELDKGEAEAELEAVTEEFGEFIQEQLQEGRELEFIILGLWVHIQEIERRLKEAPTKEDDGPEEPHNRMFY